MLISPTTQGRPATTPLPPEHARTDVSRRACGLLRLGRLPVGSFDKTLTGFGVIW